METEGKGRRPFRQTSCDRKHRQDQGPAGLINKSGQVGGGEETINGRISAWHCVGR
jgi:hypothetical protein